MTKQRDYEKLRRTEQAQKAQRDSLVDNHIARRINIPGINWGSYQEQQRLSKMDKNQKPSKVQIYNRAIHELVVIKKRRIADGESQKRINACQVEIDKMIRLRNAAIAATKFDIWRKTNQ